MPRFCVKFFNTRLSSDGHPFKVLQRIIKVRQPGTAEDAAKIAQRRFERLELVPDWKLHADLCEVEADKADPTGRKGDGRDAKEHKPRAIKR